MQWEDHPALDRSQAGQHGPEALGALGVLVAMHGREHVIARFAALREPVPAGEVSVGEDIPLHVDRATNLLAQKHVSGVLAGGEQQVRDAVGLDPVALLRDVVPVAPQAGFDMEQGNARSLRRPGAGERRVGIAPDQDRIRVLPLDHLGDAALGDGDAPLVWERPDSEVVVGERQAQVGDQQVRHSRVVMLPGVDEDLVDAACERQRERPGLDDVGPRPDDRDQPMWHRRSNVASAAVSCGRIRRGRSRCAARRPFFVLRGGTGRKSSPVGPFLV